VHAYMGCRGVPVYRVDTKTKCNKDVSSRGRYIRCNCMTNLFCIICKNGCVILNWQQITFDKKRIGVNEDDPKVIRMSFDDGKVNEKEDTFVASFHVGTSPTKQHWRQMGLCHKDVAVPMQMMMN
jgi:hypothetical protein